MKPTKVKAWPELTDYYPALPVIGDGRQISGGTSALVELDFGGVRDVTSTGLAVFVLQLLRFLGNRRQAYLRQKGAGDIHVELQNLGAIAALSERLTEPVQRDLLGENIGEESHATLRTGRSSLSVYRLRFDHFSGRREAVRAFVSWLTSRLPALAKMVPFQAHGVAMLLNEIAKNTADHTTTDAVFGMDAFTCSEGSRRLTFSFGDVGPGIKQHIQKNLPEEEKARRLAHMSLYEAYRWALRPGYTSNRTSGVNKGHGMSIIVDTAVSLGMHLSVFDAQSRGTLTSLVNVATPSHAAIRRMFHNIGHDVGFFYYGELLVPPLST